MRSFTALARTLNLSVAVAELGSTRQTVRRHIAQLEEAMGVKLFEVEQRRYVLTEKGMRALAPAQALLNQGVIWYQGQFEYVAGMLRFSFEGENGWVYHQQQQPLSTIWSCRSELLRAALKAWTLSEAMLESGHMATIRPYIVAYRENAEGWICVEVGESSFYSNWFGWAQARSSVGRNLNKFPGGDVLASLADAPFQDISTGRGVRLDQVLTKLPMGGEDGPLRFAAFDRLLMGVSLPDGSPAIMSVVDRACEVRISDVDSTILDNMPEEARIDFIN
ncbi:LysR family transcriptional regulator [Sulfitobacter sp. F26169L]|uniref:LysR family transcriptional regulator n=1 Tax=Sulfitobacter sp. F26169L TaxID=2996015 RepID=UPI002261036D|nr:LysR family transcriptional regulator [Sulfitobacter sp. F26169L]MCX7566781.1 LysR family transcriptional regulator [Sulfitobacter sp. F26169L]